MKYVSLADIFNIIFFFIIANKVSRTSQVRIPYLGEQEDRFNLFFVLVGYEEITVLGPRKNSQINIEEGVIIPSCLHCALELPGQRRQHRGTRAGAACGRKLLHYRK